MKKFAIIAVALVTVMALTVPAMALDFSATGYYRVRGIYNSNVDLADNFSDAYMDMRLRVQPTFMINDRISLVMRFDALDNKKYGHADLLTTPTDDNIDWDRAYMVIKDNFGGTWSVGRMSGGAWGTSWDDSEGDADRIKYVLPWGNWTFIPIFQKVVESDSGTATVPGVYTGTGAVTTVSAGTAATTSFNAAGNSDLDYDAWILGITYKFESATAGLLTVLYNDKRTAAQTSRDIRLNPFVTGSYGPLSYLGEVNYRYGETDVDGTVLDIDKKEVSANFEGTYNLGPLSVMLGYAYASGDSNGTGTDQEDTAASGANTDWEKVWILTSTSSNYDGGNLAGTGNLGGAGEGPAAHGMNMIYGGVTVPVNDAVSVSGLLAISDADEVPAGWEDDHGVEFDLTLSWQLMDNLSYTFIAAWLDAGDYWKQGVAATELEDTYTLWQQLKVDF